MKSPPFLLVVEAPSRRTPRGHGGRPHAADLADGVSSPVGGRVGRGHAGRVRGQVVGGLPGHGVLGSRVEVVVGEGRLAVGVRGRGGRRSVRGGKAQGGRVLKEG